jgi:cellulose synthase/poly-beta-1,6-N-acetylglucosamine synthase-like glycosyltransferase
MLSAEFIVCIDADTHTTEPLGVLVGHVAERQYDLVSVRIVPANTSGLLGGLQAHEYRSAMRLRRVMPWLVSGACHAGRREAHREVMNRHSLFFQGNDVELGWIADGLGLRVGHVLFDVPTVVPATLHSWWRQRYAWAGGEFRLFLVNPQLALRHPLLWIYGALITFTGTPMRWWGLLHPGGTVFATLILYMIMVLIIHRGHWDRWVLLLPLYSLACSLIAVPIGLISYAPMAVRHRNAGLIRLHRVERPNQGTIHAGRTRTPIAA